jgi:hypothetical protein
MPNLPPGYIQTPEGKLVRTYVVRAREKVWMGNAETPVEAVKYAIAKEGIVSDQYLVYDSFELNRWLIYNHDGIIEDSAQQSKSSPPYEGTMEGS